MRDLVYELKQLKAENERLTAERDSDIADVRRLRDELNLSRDVANAYKAKRDRLLEDLELQRKIDLQIIAEKRRLHAALTDLEMAVSDLMREEDFEVSETLSCALDIAREALAGMLPADSQTGAEINRLRAALMELKQWCKPDEHSPDEHWAAHRRADEALAGSDSQQRTDISDGKA